MGGGRGAGRRAKKERYSSASGFLRSAVREKGEGGEEGQEGGASCARLVLKGGASLLAGERRCGGGVITCGGG